MHHPWLLLALVPLGAALWWVRVSWLEIKAIEHENRRMSEDLHRRYPWLGANRDGDG